MNPRTSLAQREEIIRRTVYVSDIDQQVLKSFHLSSIVHSQPLVYNHLIVILFLGLRSLRSSLLVCLSALDRF